MSIYRQLEQLDTEAHGRLRLCGSHDHGHARGLSQVPLVIDELGEAAKCFPIVFPNGDRMQPVALLGTKRGGNVFVGADGCWLAGYEPAWLRRYPFTLARAAAADDELTVMIDRGASHLSVTEGEPLFTDSADGRQPGAPVQRALSFLRRYQQAADAVPAFFAPLTDHAVLVARDLRINTMPARRIGGMQVVDRDRVAALNDATLATWARSGLLEAVHAHWQSLTNFRYLAGGDDVD